MLPRDTVPFHAWILITTKEKVYVISTPFFSQDLWEKKHNLGQQESGIMAGGGVVPDPNVPVVKWGARACLAEHGHGRGSAGTSQGRRGGCC